MEPLVGSPIPLNLKHLGTTADYAHTGHWGKKAIADAKRFIDVNVVCDTSAEGYKHVPPIDDWTLSEDAAYVHITPNETYEKGERQDYLSWSAMMG